MLDVRFPGLGILLKNVKNGIKLFGIEFRFYGMVITLAFIVGYMVIKSEAKRTKQNDELYLDYILWMFIPAIFGARLYYVLFSSKDYFQKGKGFFKTLVEIINVRNGGLAIYGGIIAGVIVAIIFCRKRKIKLPIFADTLCLGLVIGQSIGRWGNFFNREAFGEYTDSKLRMCIPVDYFIKNNILKSYVESGIITEKMANNTTVYDSMDWISVHPTFLYESFWTLVLFIFLMIYRKHKKFDGELILLYVWGYGLGRVWIEGLRSDSLMTFGGNMKVSQLIAFVCVMVSSIILVKKRLDYAKNINLQDS